MGRDLRVTARNAAFQQWQALLSNRTKRQRAGEFLVQGVRPISLAVEYRWPVRAVLYDMDRSLSRWAEDILYEVSGAQHVAMSPELLRELGEKDGADQTPELLAVVAMPSDELSRITVGPDFLGAVFDRPTSPGNIGTIMRSVDAFGGSGVIVSGHAADPYDPKAVRASTGSLFATPVVRAPSAKEVLAWVEEIRARGVALSLVGTDEDGDADISDHDLTGPSLLLIGNETSGLSAAWREACDTMVRIPMTGSASSLNAANAATVILYEAARQRGAQR
ncbi:TrmH family RNA methyltransferase [Nocardiopsis ansamitocini]|uniref:rRNA methyltransferase n=1 Tax=Nocardiopsis ansamitocini TaxID=1670832 RepID=A0A9W6P671_9ACTN|nr:TrmH family RNA methyltransferase [Nocardiopsis ansamitocini]GLU47925.1 rRNA methyltransferase [Nocardiopsis ansamitocini]